MKKTLVLLSLLLLSCFAIQLQTSQAQTTVYNGLSGYPTSTSEVQNIINVMTANNLNLFRMSFNPTWLSGPHPYHSEYVQYFLDHTPSNWVIIVDRNHIYPPTESGASTFRSNIAVARSSILAVCAAWPNNQRVWVELGNEYVSSDFHTVFQGLIDDVRDAGYTNTLVIDKWNTAWSTAVFDDPCDAVYTGMHFYFTSGAWTTAESQMATALNLGLKLVNTEVGADYNEYSSFDASEVARLNEFLDWCTAHGVSNTVWMNENLANWPKYTSLNLDIPDGVSSSLPTPTITPTPSPTQTSTPTPTSTINPTPTTNPTNPFNPTPTPTTTPSQATIPTSYIVIAGVLLLIGWAASITYNPSKKGRKRK